MEKKKENSRAEIDFFFYAVQPALGQCTKVM